MPLLPRARFLPLLLASVVAAGMGCLVGCGKDPTGSPAASLPANGTRTASGPTAGPGTLPGAPAAAIPGPGAPEGGPPLAVAADLLARDFQADDRAAAKKYKDRWLVVEGLYKEAYQRDSGGEVSRLFYFTDYNDPFTRHTCAIKCTMDGQHWLAFDGLTPGQKVKVKARCTGGGYQSVTLADGEVQEVGPDPAVPVAAIRLAAEFAADRNKARRDYNDRWLLVEGTVQERTTKDPPAIVLEGAGEKVAGTVCVVARFRFGRDTEPGRVKKGDKVKLKGKAALFLDEGNAVLDECKLVK
jgi:hypothetical protein